MKYYADLNLGQNELQNAVLQNLPAHPSNPKPGQHYYNTTDNTEYFWNGTEWVNAAGDYTFQNGVEQVDGTRDVQLKLNTSGSSGLETFSTDSNGLKINVNEASTTTKGLIEIATDEEVVTGTSEVLAVNPKQLATKQDLVSTAVEDNITTWNNAGQTKDSGKAFTTSVAVIASASDAKIPTEKAVRSAIDAAIAGGVHYVGTWDITSATDYSGIPLPQKKGALFYVTGTGPKIIGGIEWQQNDYLLVNDDVAAGESLVNKVEKVDNTESSDIVRLDATQTLTNKTISAASNTISDLETSNLKSGVLQTTVRATTSASDTALASEKAIATLVETSISNTKTILTSPAMTTSSGVCTWSITGLASDPYSIVITDSSENEVVTDITYATKAATIRFNSSTNIAAGVFKARILM